MCIVLGLSMSLREVCLQDFSATWYAARELSQSVSSFTVT